MLIKSLSDIHGFLPLQRKVLDAACCKVLVVNGGNGRFRTSVLSTFSNRVLGPFPNRPQPDLPDLCYDNSTFSARLFQSTLHNEALTAILTLYNRRTSPKTQPEQRLQSPLPLNNHSDSNTLDTAGRKPAADFSPQQRRQLIAHHPV